MTLQDRVVELFAAHFHGAPEIIVRAPGRVNLIGEHTDYNDGFVLPLAIERAVWIALRPRADAHVIVHSGDFDKSATFALSDYVKRDALWAEYIKGVAWSMGGAGDPNAGYLLRGWEGVVIGDVPMGAGLSSSAAIEVAAARAFAAVSDIAWDAPTMARLCQKAENQWIGVNSGIMDQMISAAGVEGRAVLIDCRHLTLDAVPFPADTAIAILDTATRRSLATGSKYNERREQCEAAARHFGVSKLRDVDALTLIQRFDELDPIVGRRARHIITENARTLQAAAAMRAGAADELGRLMNMSHITMRDDFEISRAEIDTMVEIAQQHPACYGARMTGGGFGGCAVALITLEGAAAFAADVSAAYAAATALTPAVYVTTAAAGAGVV
ncbi:MAG: galactokinase [Chloroflexota bacterium]|nr:galactokinase [Chloroflexota bacterium]